jgi:hypothetical protein
MASVNGESIGNSFLKETGEGRGNLEHDLDAAANQNFLVVSCTTDQLFCSYRTAMARVFRMSSTALIATSSSSSFV